MNGTKANNMPHNKEQLKFLREKAKEDNKQGAVVRAYLNTYDTEDDVPEAHDGYVYVAEAEDGMVKIGKSVRPEQRLRSLSTGSPYELTLLVKNKVAESRSKEAKLQRVFDDYRVRGEWFEVSDSVKQEIIEEVKSL